MFDAPSQSAHSGRRFRFLVMIVVRCLAKHDFRRTRFFLVYEEEQPDENLLLHMIAILTSKGNTGPDLVPSKSHPFSVPVQS